MIMTRIMIYFMSMYIVIVFSLIFIFCITIVIIFYSFLKIFQFKIMLIHMQIYIIIYFLLSKTIDFIINKDKIYSCFCPFESGLEYRFFLLNMHTGLFVFLIIIYTYITNEYDYCLYHLLMNFLY